MESILPQTEYINYAANKQESELMIQGSSSCIVSDIGSGGNSERKGLGVNGSLDVGMPLEISSAQRVDYHLGDQFWHLVVDVGQKNDTPFLNSCSGTPLALLENVVGKVIHFLFFFFFVFFFFF
jgi:hypothetical protein